MCLEFRYPNTCLNLIQFLRWRTFMRLIELLLQLLKGMEKDKLINLKKNFFADTKMSDEEFINLISKYQINYKKCCPKCGSTNFVKAGFTNKGLQRYKCHEHKGTFSTFTGTPYAYSKKDICRWIQFIKLMTTGASIRLCAKACNLNIATAFFWRHKILKAILEMLPKNLRGIIEINEVFFAESFKGNHSKSKHFDMPREPRKRGLTYAEYLDADKVAVLACKDRSQNMFASAADHCRVRFPKAYALLNDKIPEKSILCTNNNMAYIGLAKFLNCILYKMHYVGEVKEGKYHIINVSNLCKKIKRIINYKFKGVASKYLNHYLAWIHCMERVEKYISEIQLIDMLSMTMYSAITLRISDFKDIVCAV